jgi:hypothetical protein
MTKPLGMNLSEGLRGSTRGRLYVPLGFYLTAAYVVASVFVVATVSGWRGGAYWAAPLSAAVQFAGAAASRELRLRCDQWLTPGNFALGMWFLELVILPALLIVHIPCQGPLRVLPSDADINTAMLVQALAFAAFAVFFVRRIERVHEMRKSELSVRPISLPVVVGLMAIGVLGMVLMFRTPAAAWAYYTGHAQLMEPGGRTSLSQGVSALMRPFLGLAGIAFIQRGISAGRTSMRLLSSQVLFASALIFAGYSTYQYNRQAAVAAVLSLIAALSLKVRRVGLPLIAAMAVIGIISAITFGTYRLIYIGTRAGEFSTWQVGLQNYRPDPLEQLEVYMGAPQFVALSIQASDNGTRPVGPKPVLASALSPIPVLGKPFRRDSTTSMYNERIYGTGRVLDQHPPFVAELFWTLGVIGVIGGFAMLGWMSALIDQRFKLAHDLLDGYVYTFLGISLASLMSFGVAVLAQTSLYFCLPIFLLSILMKRRPPQMSREMRNP